MTAQDALRLRRAATILRAGGVIAYPTEAVFGLGADPRNAAAVARLLAIKRRPVRKGLILIGDSLGQLAPYIAPLDEDTREHLSAGWPAALTWLVPAAPDAPRWITGGHERIAVRVPDHALARALCRAWGDALVSTSANRGGRQALRTALAVRRHLGRSLDAVVPGAVGGRAAPSEIRELATGRVVRGGG